MKKFITKVLILTVIGGGTAEATAQGWLKRLGKTIENAAKSAVERNVERATEQAVDNAFQKTGEAVNDAVNNNGNDDNNSSSSNNSSNNSNNSAGLVVETAEATPVAVQSGQQSGQVVEMAYAKSDFVPGDEIIFDDPMDNEQLGEWPSQWELYDGIGEVASVGGKRALLIHKISTKVGPLMKNPLNYLGEIFTIEFDYFYPTEGAYHSYWRLYFHPADNKSMHSGDCLMRFAHGHSGEGCDYNWQTTMSESSGEEDVSLLKNQWNHIAISFNKRAWKVYVNGVRVVNVPNVKTPPGWFHIEVENGDRNMYFTNLRIAKGAVPLYDRMMSEGKFITYGITFDVGKATIKPESMGEINRIVKLMNENPDLKFSVEGHTDSTGNATNNQSLSEQRSKAIVAKLVELGIAQGRLTAVGKGQNSPIADNSTDEGRAKNRRVEFVKM